MIYELGDAEYGQIGTCQRTFRAVYTGYYTPSFKTKSNVAPLYAEQQAIMSISVLACILIACWCVNLLTEDWS